MYDIIETDTCSCCSDLNHQRIIQTVKSLIEAADYLATGYNNDQLLEGLFDDIVIENETNKYTASECLKAVGYTKKILCDMKNTRLNETRKWLNLS